MSAEDVKPAETGTDAGIQQIPVTIRVREVPAAVEALEKLLQAIAAEAQTITDKLAGQSSAALESLARAYALVTGVTAAAPTSETTTVPLATRAGEHQVGLCLELEP